MPIATIIFDRALVCAPLFTVASFSRVKFSVSAAVRLSLSF